MKKVLWICTCLTAVCSLAFADLDNVSKADAAVNDDKVAYVNVLSASLNDVSEVKTAIVVLEAQIAENKARDLEVPAEWVARLESLYSELGQEPLRNRGNLDQGGEDCANATVIPAVPYADTGLKGATDDCVGRPYADVFYVYTVATTGNHTADMCLSDDDSYLRVWTAGTCCVGASSLFDDECGGLDPRGTLSLTAGQVVYFECGNYSNPGLQNNYAFNLSGPTPPPPGDVIATAIPHTLGECVDGTTVGYNHDYDAVCPYSGSLAPDVVYTFVAGALPVTFSLCQGTTNYDTKIYILASDGVTLVACNDDACTAPNYGSPYVSRLDCVPLTNGDRYYIVVDGYGGGSGLYTLCTSVCEVCVVECPAGGRPEGEPCPNIPDNFNGGCNSIPAVFSPIGCNDLVCGTAEAGQGQPGFRDTDWYSLNLAARESLTVCYEAEYPSYVFVIHPTRVDSPCVGYQIVAQSALIAACDVYCWSSCLDAGEYWIIPVPAAFDGIPCGDYVLSTHCEPCAPEAVCDFPNRDFEDGNDLCGSPDAGFIACDEYLCGEVNPAADQDFYRINIPAGTCAILHIDVFANATPGWYPFGRGLDSYIELWDADCNYITGDDDGGIGFDSHLDTPCLPGGSYFLNVRGFANVSVGPYILYVTCEACQCPCTPESATFDGRLGAPQYACIELCPDQASYIYVLNGNAHEQPIVTLNMGCSPTNTNCDRECNAATEIASTLPWTYIEGVWVSNLYGNGCVCVCLEGFEAAEMGSFTALPRDRSVTLNWSTLSESNVSHFEISRCPKGHDAEMAVVGSIEAANLSSGSTYSWTDNNVLNGTTYVYSMVIVDIDGSRAAISSTVEATPSLDAAVVTEYALHQNFPNPFNPTTSITFDMVEAGNVTLTIYNTVGQQVATVLSGAMDAGRHVVTFDARSLPSGMYLYRIEANGFTAMKKMVLMK